MKIPWHRDSHIPHRAMPDKIIEVRSAKAIYPKKRGAEIQLPQSYRGDITK